MTLSDGSTIGGYRVVRELGRGAASVVVQALPPGGGTPVAVKVGLPGAVGADELRGRLLRGARAQERLDHPGIVRVLATGHDDALGPYVVMELVDGRPLSGLLRAGELPADPALDLLGQVAAALDHAHAAGVRHRDVKPSNILVDADLRRARLADFGLARDAADAALTTTHGLAGTLQYLAPEVIRGGEPDAAADRYAFAATLYEALVGEPVFVRPTDAAVLFAHAQEEPEAPSARRPELGEAADAPLLWALAKDPAARPATAVELVAQVRDALGDHAAALPSPPAAIGPAPQAATVDVPAPDSASSSRGRGLRPGAWLAIGVVAGIVVPIVVLILVTLGGGDDAVPAGDDAVPSAGAGFEVLGASLQPSDDIASGDCRGAAPTGSSPACTLLQTELPGRRVVVRSDGALRAWAVRGARGELALQVLRRRSGEIFQVARSQPAVVPDAGAHRFTAELAVEAGDVLALAVAPGAQVGRRPVAGAQLERWEGPVGVERREGESSDGQELQLRAEVEAGGTPTPPRQVTGAAAAALPAGEELDVSEAALPDGRRVRVALVQVGDDISIDLFRGGTRRARIAVPDLEPGGRVVEFRAFESAGNDSQLNLLWRNPGVQARIEHYYGLSAESLEFYS